MLDRVTIPETNPEVDVYRVGTLLELVREIASALALDGKRVKVCVQGAMGSGSFKVPSLCPFGAPPFGAPLLHSAIMQAHFLNPC